MDDNDRCGEHQLLSSNGLRCVCAEGYVVSADGGCLAAPPPDPSAPTGVGTPCTSDADCVTFDANYCELLVSHTCVVQNCTRTPSSCYQGFDCCSFANSAPPFNSLPTLCLAQGLCPP